MENLMNREELRLAGQVLLSRALLPMVVLANLKARGLKLDLYDTMLSRTYREMERFVINPNRTKRFAIRETLSEALPSESLSYP